jgi:protoporphyrinogen oxidase
MKVIVVGAGIAGLGAAVYFSRKGHDVLVLESSDRVGGRAVRYRRPDSEDFVDAGTQYYHTSYKRARALIDDADLTKSLQKVQGFTRIYDDRLKGGSFRFNRKLPWYRSTGIFGNLRLGAYLASTFTRYHMDPYVLTPDTSGDDIDAVANTGSRVVYDSIIRPMTQVGALSEPEAMDLSLLQLHRLIHIILFSDYLSLSGGTVSLHEALAARLRIRLGTTVVQIVEEKGRIAGVALAGGSDVIRADHVVVCTTPNVAAGMLPREWQDEIDFLAGINIPSFNLPVFFLDRPLEKDVWSYLLHQRNNKIAYLTNAAVKNPAMVPSGNAVIQPWICYPHSAELVNSSDDEIIALCLSEIEEVMPGFTSWVEHSHVTRHEVGVPFHSTGHAQKARAFLHHADRRGISFCGDYLSGGYMESALWSAERAAKIFG